jgi:hypothetical protein
LQPPISRTVIPRALLPRIALVATLVAALAPAAARAAAQESPCDDPSFARDFKARYPGELDKLWEDEQKQREAWNVRADTISRQVVFAGATTPSAQSTFRLQLARRSDIAALDERIAQAASEFRERNIALQGAVLISPLDPMRPYRAWCVMAVSALDAMKTKVALEGQQWQLVDQALLAAAANKGVRFAP